MLEIIKKYLIFICTWFQEGVNLKYKNKKGEQQKINVLNNLMSIIINNAIIFYAYKMR